MPTNLQIATRYLRMIKRSVELTLKLPSAKQGYKQDTVFFLFFFFSQRIAQVLLFCMTGFKQLNHCLFTTHWKLDATKQASSLILLNHSFRYSNKKETRSLKGVNWLLKFQKSNSKHRDASPLQWHPLHSLLVSTATEQQPCS